MASKVRRRAALRHPRRRPRRRSSPGAGAAMAAQSASGIPLELVGLVTPLPADGGGMPGEILEHEAHAVGHAAVLLADRGVLLAGDMLSDVLIPLLDARRPGQVGAYRVGAGAAGRGRQARRCRGSRPRGRVPGSRGGGPPGRRSCLYRRVAARRGACSTRVWGRMRTGSPAPTSRTCSRPEGGRGLCPTRATRAPRAVRRDSGRSAIRRSARYGRARPRPTD